MQTDGPLYSLCCPVISGIVGLSGDHGPPPHDMVFPALFHSRQHSGYHSRQRTSGFALQGSGRVFACDVCQAIFTTTAGLRGHKDRVHLNKAAYTCDICHKGFTMRGHYVGHMNMHNKVKAFKCHACPRAFAHRTSLRTHLRTSRCGYQQPALGMHIKARDSPPPPI